MCAFIRRSKGEPLQAVRERARPSCVTFLWTVRERAPLVHGTDARCLLRDPTMTEILMSTVSTETNPQTSKVSRELQYTDKRQRAIRKACRSALFTGSAQRSNL